MASFQNVALLGKGFLGSAVLEQLAEAQFTTTVLTRSQSSLKDIPPGVQVREVDYTSIDSLKDALRGNDVVVSTLNPASVPLQKVVIDASIAVRVKRFIPADFGAMSTDPAAQSLPVHSRVVEIQKYLIDKADAGEIEYTLFAVGGFLERMFTMPVAVDWENHTAAMYDGGDNAISLSSLSTIGRAVAAALNKPEETKNRVVRVHDIILTQRKIFALAKKLTPGKTWTETAVDSEAAMLSLFQQLQTEGVTLPVYGGIFKAAFFGKKYETAYKSVDNEFLGLGFKSEEDVEKIAVELVQHPKL
ncbi:hypothetical protein BJX96DRAFT_181778 [Aspergillus floccosus]